MSAAIDTVSIWRIAVEGRDYGAEDRSGKGVELRGGRWNRKELPVLYTAENIALACLETLVHLGPSLPLNRYLVRFDLEAQDWGVADDFRS
ncbi:RES family NAD+ phosphorylase [Synechococcus elongatus]|uniref:RES family NAD+ phosphorylase n=1 Tax=Synechococcus elongatus TaxID=32046 RepID=UPI0030CB1C56